jgi:hypothetical protein
MSPPHPSAAPRRNPLPLRHLLIGAAARPPTPPG